jgi:predicted RNA-binding Zn-ribbon protein involved in translation (DUF1610 family)
MSDVSDERVFPADEVRTTTDAGELIDQGRGRIFPCDQCGADLEFSVGQQSLQCPFCGAIKQIAVATEWPLIEHDYLKVLDQLQQRKTVDLPPQDAETGYHQVRCESCGAEVVFQGTLTSSSCPYCASPLQRAGVHDVQSGIAVDGMLPFQVPREQAAERLAAWVKSRWFAPNQFLRQGAQGKFSGCFFPYFTYDSVTFTKFTGRRGDHYYVTVGSGKNRRTERRTRWTPVSGSFQRTFDDVLVMVARDEHRELLRELEPWPLGQCRPFAPEYLAGFFARTHDVPLDEGFEQAKERMDVAIVQEIRQRIGGDTQSITSKDTRHGAVTFKHILLPVWLLVYRYQNRPFRVTVNAVTGEVHGERPYSWVKITLAVLGAAAFVGGVWLMTQS